MEEMNRPLEFEKIQFLSTIEGGGGGKKKSKTAKWRRFRHFLSGRCLSLFRGNKKFFLVRTEHQEIKKGSKKKQ